MPKQEMTDKTVSVPQLVNDDFVALGILRQNFLDDRGMLKRKDVGYEPNSAEWQAINYLCDEWDYSYEG